MTPYLAENKYTPCCGAAREFSAANIYIVHCTYKEEYSTSCMEDNEDYKAICQDEEIVCIEKETKVAICGKKIDMYNYNPKKYKLKQGMSCTGWESAGIIGHLINLMKVIGVLSIMFLML